MPFYRLPDEMIFPDPQLAEEDGLIAIGGDLSVDRLITAYSTGIFPWYSEGQPILWFCPDPRMVLYAGKFNYRKSLQRVVASGKFEVRIDTNFRAVIEACAATPRPDQDGTWITEDMKDAYERLHHLGLAHSFETYQDNQLVGGLYGISLGKAFFGESMFHHQQDASKVAFQKLVEYTSAQNFHFIDAQTPTPHLASLGAEEIPRVQFLKDLHHALAHPTHKGPWTH
ncbi:MAG: leucyl/phenylalanyl-tRNA--protein transferase [Verrucomicrobiota bacterium]